ncbi:hypothetical protein [Methanohalophilus mahii]|uniref:Uncharacterized protein n=1 Tax=Methanohalophilus mahii (strain ATCC 35705 / DSM 5219 / SLP) TaxID=547558 RepID=D5EA27_METMS|nr:hypothetical protein [Methanohalophilus mahii]ADE36028.1 hypothetical protein Mmah_0501 [Methanohalophilus mahii DSM 5219]
MPDIEDMIIGLLLTSFTVALGLYLVTSGSELYIPRMGEVMMGMVLVFVATGYNNFLRNP